MITIYDIARKTGYAPSTVSKVLNNYKGVSEKTKKNIKKAMQEMDYIPNVNARSLMNKNSYLIGVIANDDCTLMHPHFSEIFEGFKKYIDSKGYDMIFIGPKIGGLDVTYYKHCKYRNLDGVLLAVSDTSDQKTLKEIEEISISDLPSVSVESNYEGMSLIVSDNYSASLEALDYLYYLGHREIAYVDVSNCSKVCSVRRKAYVDFLEKNKLKVRKEFLLESESFSYESGIEVGKKFIKNGISNLPTAIFVFVMK